MSNQTKHTPPVLPATSDAALAMIADMDRTHGIELTRAESDLLQSALAEVAMSHVFRSRWFARQCKGSL